MTTNTTPFYILRTENLKRFLNDIRDRQPLTADQEFQLALLAQQGDKAAANKLVEHNLLYAITEAKQYANYGLEFDDIVSAACNGVLRAIKSFDPSRGFKFITHAKSWIRKEIMDAVAEELRNVRIPTNQQANMHKINKAKERFYQTNGYYPTAELLEDELMDQLNLSKTEISNLISLSARESSIDADNSYDNDGNEILNNDFIRISMANNSFAADKELMSDDLHTMVCDYCKSVLNQREWEIIKLLYGIDCEKCSASTVAILLNITPDRIHQIHREALKKLKNSRDIYGLDVA